MVGTKHCHTKKACKTPEYQFITGHQYVTPLLFPIFSFKESETFAYPMMFILFCKNCWNAAMSRLLTKSKNCLTSNEIVWNYCVCHTVAFEEKKTFYLKTYLSCLLTYEAQNNDLQLVTCCHMVTTGYNNIWFPLR